MDHADFASALWGAFVEKTGLKRRINLPNSSGLDISGTKAHATLKVSKDAVGINMQNAPSAIEGWALALMTWMGTERVTLDWQQPGGSAVNAPHFQRFLYRVKRFADLLGPDLVHVAQPEQLGALRINDPEVRLTINVASGSCTADMRSTEKSEAEIEKAFVRKDSLPRQLLKAHLKLDKLDRQFPVGVFDGEPTRDGRIFAGGKSAVDLIGLDADKALHLFELKVDGNISVGAVSELFFYAMVIHDLKAGRIVFSQKKVGARMSLTKDDVLGAQSIHAKLFAHDFHPLITPEMLKLLSDGARRLGWPIDFDMLKLEPFLNPDG